MADRLRTVGMVALAAALSTGSLGAQQTPIPVDSAVPAVRPGDGTVNGAAIRPHSNRWVITYFMPDGELVPGGPRRVATWYDSVSLTPLADRQTLHRKQVLLAPGGGVPLETIDSWADPASLAPIRTENHYASGGASLREYHGSRVTGFDPDSAAPDGTRKVDVTLPEPVFDFFGGMYDLLLSGFPLQTGYRVRFPADFGGAKEGAALQWVTITVTGREAIDAGASGTLATWHVVTGPTPVGRFEFWIADQTPYMIRMWYIGPRGGRQVWSMR